MWESNNSCTITQCISPLSFLLPPSPSLSPLGSRAGSYVRRLHLSGEEHPHHMHRQQQRHGADTHNGHQPGKDYLRLTGKYRSGNSPQYVRVHDTHSWHIFYDCNHDFQNLSPFCFQIILHFPVIIITPPYTYRSFRLVCSGE